CHFPPSSTPEPSVSWPHHGLQPLPQACDPPCQSEGFLPRYRGPGLHLWLRDADFLTPSPQPPLVGLVDPCLPPVSPPRALHTPVFTNHLIQLVSNSNKTPQSPLSDHIRPNTRRFPGPAGMLPHQVPSSQTEEEDFSGGPWAAMKAERGLDERNSPCFLHSYSVAMVLRKAALKQLAKNKVPNMAVVLKSILHTHPDAKAVFRDPTGKAYWW
uniref:Uncharacterized protein n=1 Tax=Hucho hucho TaxID=62062 RepID=A0A4W5PZ77_9TELE